MTKYRTHCAQFYAVQVFLMFDRKKTKFLHRTEMKNSPAALVHYSSKRKNFILQQFLPIATVHYVPRPVTTQFDSMARETNTTRCQRRSTQSKKIKSKYSWRLMAAGTTDWLDENCPLRSQFQSRMLQQIKSLLRLLLQQQTFLKMQHHTRR